MPKKDVNDTILNLLSKAGATTKPMREPEPEPTPAVETEPTVPVVAEPEPATAVPDPDPEPEPLGESAVAPAASPIAAADRMVRPTPAAPLTIRLRPGTAQALRDAWLAAKRDDVLLTIQDFASDLVDGVLAAHTDRNRAAS